MGVIVNYIYVEGEFFYNVLVDGESIEVYCLFYGLLENMYNVILYYEISYWGMCVFLVYCDDYFI